MTYTLEEEERRASQGGLDALSSAHSGIANTHSPRPSHRSSEATEKSIPPHSKPEWYPAERSARDARRAARATSESNVSTKISTIPSCDALVYSAA
jgi:hypothetical protein